MFSFVFHQEKLLHRNSDFHATEDHRGITQRAKRSPGKQPETGMFVFFMIIYYCCVFCLYSLIQKLYADTLALVSQVSPSVFVRTFSDKTTLQTIALWCTCISLFSGYVLGNGLVDCWATVSVILVCLEGIQYSVNNRLLVGLRLLNFENSLLMVSHFLWNWFFTALCLLNKATPPHNVAEFIEQEIKWNGIDYYLDSKQGQQWVWEGFTNLKQTAKPSLISPVSK